MARIDSVPARHGAPVQVVASGLDSPRHLAFGARGDLFVAEAGRGGTDLCFLGGEGPACMGATGAVTEVDRRGHQHRIISGLPSMADTPGDGNGIGPHASPSWAPTRCSYEPGGIAVGKDGLYVSDNGGSPGGGQVLRIRGRF